MKQEVVKIGTEIVKAVETMKENGQEAVKKQTKKGQKSANLTICKAPVADEDKKVQEVDEMQKEIERRTKELQKCLEELERKKQLSNNRTAFILALDQLEEAGKKLNERTDFETNLYRLRFIDVSASYSGNEIFAISNSFVLTEFIDFMKAKIKEKVQEIEALLMAD